MRSSRRLDATTKATSGCARRDAAGTFVFAPASQHARRWQRAGQTARWGL
ncbi:hypothetical protein DIQ79_26295 [Mycolicibacterium smegmatis]|uniref:Uncharacterized protein n=1 Tax=Mycolicibacterium smegmatis (strain ATCC 700084 / mc(2)155) TaxID=246196 RepID=A0QVZ4_MYCS2|nr:hypothetical protein MSMEG_2751 [Mycolicibacterium smegmatis MC2 155]TBM42975.1 hypothetical protein DIQ86_19625 [Mycolicibacterium smegmatis]TBH30495.1 hypothetical protein EYS45_26215 [Mycolicibacterium smegmatis MC2 155]TBM47374.1 hypothetical protein DIQ85_26755 [Mycolicibacterium smegmatis]TBM56849.1 hypothetical protein DIQ83_26275 [Mycolicibacterium smegmatis]